MRASLTCSLFLAAACVAACSDHTSTLGALGDTQGLGGKAGTNNAAGATAAGGATSSGGTGAAAGASAAGGSSASAGSSAEGGASASAGSTATGGSTAPGGTGAAAGATAAGGSSGAAGAMAAAGSSGVAGTTAAGGTSALGGSGGSGGTSSVCGPLVLDGPPRGINLVASDTRRQLSPVLVRSNSGFAATLVYHWTSLPGGTVTGVRFLPFKPFDPWPSTDFGPTFGGEPYDFQAPIAAASGFGTDGTEGYNVAVLAHDPGFGAETGSMTFLPGASPPFAQSNSLVLESLDSGTPAFVATGGGRHYVGYGVLSPNAGGGSRGVLRGGIVDDGKYQKDNLLSEQACATSAIVADAIPFGESFLVAHSTSRICCSCDNGVDGPPDQVSVRVAGSAEQSTFPSDRVVTFVKLVAKKNGGAWLLIGRASNALPATIELGQLDPSGKSTAPFLTIASPSAGFTVSAEALGDDLVVATHRPTAGGSAIDLEVFGPNGNAASKTTLELSSLFANRVPTLLGNLAGSQIVLAWSEPDLEVTSLEEDHVKVARFARTCPSP